MDDGPLDEQMEDVEEKVESLPLSADERRVLELYDRLQQLQLEIAIIKAQSSISPGEFPECPFSYFPFPARETSLTRPRSSGGRFTRRFSNGARRAS
jgi:hypothetical protein